jgi:hypothetical protein
MKGLLIDEKTISSNVQSVRSVWGNKSRKHELPSKDRMMKTLQDQVATVRCETGFSPAEPVARPSAKQSGILGIES